MNKAVFFDRDNTLMHNVPYLGDPEKVVLIPNADKVVPALSKAGFKIFLVSNQSGVGRGYITSEQVDAVNSRLKQLIGKEYFTDVYCCFDDPNAPQENCRKPNPSLLLRAQKDYDLNLKSSYMVGDRLADLKAGKNAGCRSLYFLTDYHPEENEEAQRLADFTADNLLDMMEWILADQGIK